MKLYTLERRQSVQAPLASVWRFFSDPHNLACITPPDLNLVVPADTPRHVYPGMIMSYDLRPMAGVRTKWITEITQVIDGQMFVDEQRFGPYRFWHHQHHFRETGGGVEVRDVVHYALPFGFLGRIVYALGVRTRLARIFDYRVEAIKREFPATPVLLPDRPVIRP